MVEMGERQRNLDAAGEVAAEIILLDRKDRAAAQ
jgi:hypothetical protein